MQPVFLQLTFQRFGVFFLECACSNEKIWTTHFNYFYIFSSTFGLTKLFWNIEVHSYIHKQNILLNVMLFFAAAIVCLWLASQVVLSVILFIQEELHAHMSATVVFPQLFQELVLHTVNACQSTGITSDGFWWWMGGLNSCPLFYLSFFGWLLESFQHFWDSMHSVPVFLESFFPWVGRRQVSYPLIACAFPLVKLGWFVSCSHLINESIYKIMVLFVEYVVI